MAMLRRAAIFLVIIFGISLAAPCYCQERAIKTLDGTISDMDWAKSEIAVKWLNTSDNSYRETVLNMPDDAVIRKGTDTIQSSELQIADEVTVEYYEDADGNAILKNMEVSSP